jgi:DNA repair exonuclease SbcCD ATPase subunit
MALTLQIQQVSDKLQLLLKQYNDAQKEVQKLTKEKVSLQNQLKEKTTQALKLQQSIESLRFTSVGLNDDVKKDLEKRINVYLKEIDNCLALLNG